MANPTISQIKVGDITYDICDENLRNTLFNLNNFDIKANNIYIGNKSNADVIKIQSRTRDQNVNFLQIYNGATHGSGLVFGAGGLTVIGGGEAAENIRAKVIADGGLDSNEQLHLGSDDKIYFHSNCNDITTKKTMILDTSGDLTVPGNIIPKSQTKNTIFAAPNGSNGAPSFRTLVAADIPNLAASKITSGTLGVDRIPAHSTDKLTSGTLPLDRGGTGATTKKAAFKALGGWTSVATTSGTTAKTFTNVSTTGYTEILVMASYAGTVGSTDYKSSIVIPVVQLSSGGDDYYLGGGWWSNSYGASANISLTKITPYPGRANGSTVNMSWAIYGR